MKKFALAAAAAVLGLSAQANAAEVITSAEVSGLARNSVWDTNANTFYTLFVGREGALTPLNPNDERISAPVTDNGLSEFRLDGDGFPLAPRGGPAPNSSTIYNLLLTFGSGNTLTGSYDTSSNFFTGGTSFTNGGQTYSLTEFSFDRFLGDRVSEFRFAPGGDGNDYVGNFSISALAAAGAVPEPATWAMLILGFGMVGGSMRYSKRRTRTSVKFA